jgi:hypothetical protein
MQCINFCFYSECFIEEPCAGNPQARFCGGYHNTYTNFRHMLWFLPDIASKALLIIISLPIKCSISAKVLASVKKHAILTQ